MPTSPPPELKNEKLLKQMINLLSNKTLTL